MRSPFVVFCVVCRKGIDAAFCLALAWMDKTDGRSFRQRADTHTA